MEAAWKWVDEHAVYIQTTRCGDRNTEGLHTSAAGNLRGGQEYVRVRWGPRVVMWSSVSRPMGAATVTHMLQFTDFSPLLKNQMLNKKCFVQPAVTTSAASAHLRRVMFPNTDHSKTELPSSKKPKFTRLFCALMFTSSSSASRVSSSPADLETFTFSWLLSHFCKHCKSATAAVSLAPVRLEESAKTLQPDLTCCSSKKTFECLFQQKFDLLNSWLKCGLCSCISTEPTAAMQRRRGGRGCGSVCQLWNIRLVFQVSSGFKANKLINWTTSNSNDRLITLVMFSCR